MKNSQELRSTTQAAPSWKSPAGIPETAVVPGNPDPLPEKSETSTEHSMRWEDDGGPAAEAENDESPPAAAELVRSRKKK
ncbi:MAG TPA: hypothetical protein VFH29_04855 [Anaerolineales bacterium]|nr:hypothetical protein [Anaerolineales bacterium]